MQSFDRVSIEIGVEGLSSALQSLTKGLRVYRATFQDVQVVQDKIAELIISKIKQGFAQTNLGLSAGGNTRTFPYDASYRTSQGFKSYSQYGMVSWQVRISNVEPTARFSVGTMMDGQGSGTAPPMEALKRWIAEKGETLFDYTDHYEGYTERNVERLAYIFAQNIGKMGLDPVEYNPLTNIIDRSGELNAETKREIEDIINAHLEIVGRKFVEKSKYQKPSAQAARFARREARERIRLAKLDWTIAQRTYSRKDGGATIVTQGRDSRGRFTASLSGTAYFDKAQRRITK